MEMTRIALVLVAISSMCAMSMAQSSSGISNQCTNVLITLSPCLNYITGNSSTPGSSCCSQLGSVVKSSPECLCEVVNSGGSGVAAGLNINQTLALQLPKACDIDTPAISSCSKASSPSGSPAGTSPSTPSSTPSSTLGGGSKTTPTTQGDSSDASMSKLPKIPVLLASLYVASYALHFNNAV